MAAFSPAGRVMAIFRANSFAESSRFAAWLRLGRPIETRRKRIARRERLDRSAAIIGALRPASRNIRKNSTRWSGLEEIIAQALGGAAVRRHGVALVAQTLVCGVPFDLG